MELILRKLREARQHEEGFTLIELLIVILVLGILTGIAIFATDPFQKRATEACGETNAQILKIADAATDAGITGDLYSDPPSGCESVAGPPTFDASVVQTDEETDDNGGPFETVNITTTAGNLLVAVSAYANDNQPIPTMAGWNLRGSVVTNVGSDRSIAVYTKLAAGGAESVSIDWCGTCTAASLLVAEIEAGGEALTNASFTGTAGGNDIANLTLAAASAPAGSAVVISGLVVRDGSQSVSWTGGVSSLDSIGSGGVFRTFTGFADVEGPGSFGATADWTDNLDASGFVLVMSP